MRISVIALGNTLRGDDGVAASLLDMIEEEHETGLSRHKLGLHCELIGDCLRDCDAAIIVDATKSGFAAGTVHEVDLIPLIASATTPAALFCHGLSFIDELLIVARMQPLPEKLIFFGVEIAASDWGEGISPELSQRLPGLKSRLLSRIRRLKTTP